MPDMGNVPLVGHGANAGRPRRVDGALNVTLRTQRRLQPAGTASGFDPLK
jgi:hypothetical protein